MNIIDELADFIKETKEPKEIKRALAVKMILEGKSYQEVKELLKVSHSFISQWKIRALYAPEQNPVEDIWLQVKTFIRQFYHLCRSFKIVKWLFKFFAEGQIFDFQKIFQYGKLPQSI